MTKQIPLSQSKFALVDDEDFEFINQWKWCVNNYGYAVRRNPEDKMIKGKRRTRLIFLHRIINKTPDGFFTDHKNGNTLDNQKKNLRNCTSQQNQRNKKSHKNSSSKFKGVSFYKSRNNWRVHIKTSNKFLFLGYFGNEIDAAKKYNKAAIQYFGEFAKLNVFHD